MTYGREQLERHAQVLRGAAASRSAELVRGE